MAKDDSRRATPRASAKPVKASAPSKAPKASKPAKAVKSPQSGSQRPAGASAKRGASKRVVLAEPQNTRTRDKAAQTGGIVGALVRLVIGFAVVAALAFVGYYVLRMTSAFTILSIDTEATEHLSEEDIANLAGVVEGTTLLNIDEDAVAQSVKRNPWVMDVAVHREFPDKLKIVVTERKVSTLVLMSTSAFAWYVGDGNVWLEPATLDLTDGQTAKDAAQALAAERKALLIIDVPATINPQAGSEVSDEVILAVDTYLKELPEELSSQIVYFSASSTEAISCVLSSGVEVSLGAPEQIEQKVAVLTQILEQYPGEITYVNVRVPGNPSYRRIDSDTVQPGSGA